MKDGGEAEKRGHIRAWEGEYRSRGRLWAGSPPPLPRLPPGSRVLELGCGSGKTLSAMLERGWWVAALDVSEAAARICGEVAGARLRMRAGSGSG